MYSTVWVLYSTILCSAIDENNNAPRSFESIAKAPLHQNRYCTTVLYGIIQYSIIAMNCSEIEGTCCSRYFCRPIVVQTNLHHGSQQYVVFQNTWYYYDTVQYSTAQYRSKRLLLGFLFSPKLFIITINYSFPENWTPKMLNRYSAIPWHGTVLHSRQQSWLSFHHAVKQPLVSYFLMIYFIFMILGYSIRTKYFLKKYLFHSLKKTNLVPVVNSTRNPETKKNRPLFLTDDNPSHTYSTVVTTEMYYK